MTRRIAMIAYGASAYRAILGSFGHTIGFLGNRVEYLHLVRTADGWRIVNAFWQESS